MFYNTAQAAKADSPISYNVDGNEAVFNLRHSSKQLSSILTSPYLSSTVSKL